MPGQGSLFRTEIKGSGREETGSTRVPALERVTGLAQGQPEYRILIVEDQQENWMVIGTVAHECGVSGARSGEREEGVKQFCEWRPQFIWMDLRMPVMNGIEATRLHSCV